MKKIAVIGLGYVGLPLAIEFGKKREVLGFDINKNRIEELKKGIDNTLESTSDELASAEKLKYSCNSMDLQRCEIFIIAVPTPIDLANRPDMLPLINATKTVSKFLKKGDIVIYESTVYPGATEEICVPIIEKESKLKFNIDFYCGYSPERINPGDKKNTLTKIKKITSGSTEEIAVEIDELYNEIIEAGTHKAKSIKVAEAAKVIENTQRDLNISFMNELSIIFRKIGIDTLEVLEAAGTKWNFLPFKPGLVGGHCIGVDPYYLTHKAQEIGYHPEVILAGRRINDGMANYVAEETIKIMLSKDIEILKSKILIMGLSFKENCPDIRNSKVIDIYKKLKEFKVDIDVHDPWVDTKYAENETGIRCIEEIKKGQKYDAIIFAVAHDQFRKMRKNEIKLLGKKNVVVIDVKGILNKEEVDFRL